MAQKTTIEWTDVSWNPVHGCSKVSPGCAHCYAETLSRRYNQTLKPWTPANAAHNVLLKPHKLREPLSKAKPWDKPCRVFVNSMSDLFHEQIPDSYIAQVFGVMESAPQHTFQVLTKRPERMRDLMLEWYRPTACDPPPNVWLGTSIENRRYVDRARILGETPAAVRFISAEPLLGPLVCERMTTSVDGMEWEWEDDYTGPMLPFYNADGELGFHWLIVGGESGPGHRRVDPDWVRSLRDVCVHEGVAFFFKQWGGARPKSNGRTLDGRTWDQMPDEVNV